ncbi:DNA-binding MarR family transcriptional regulator [Crossiella equi]|uniref:DNA-binding MarR family transcriptional regulator n=1 Tax=Crossiella equi TaxID=130796 RepID=A0ABS5ATI9_9PSEU|nr:hypothetical protein [Crossiella equi]MBP2479567.1 DNA-binding MarR family transcriptional regulator [Crossiella equi]
MGTRLLYLAHLGRRTGVRREAVVALTPKGRRVVRRVTANRRKEIARIVATMPVTRRRGLLAALTAFTEAGGEPPADRSGVFAPDENWL